jgi:hypothetical protein
MKGEIMQRRALHHEAQRSLELVLGQPDQAYMPPVVAAPLKLKALEMLAESWARMGRKDVAVSVLQLGMAFAQGRIPRDGAMLAQCYQASRTPSLGRAG